MGIIIPKMGIKKTTQKYDNPPPVRQGIADALFTATQQKVLTLLFGQPERSFYASEIIALAGAGSGAVQRELKRLSESGLLTVCRIGNQKHFQANKQSPIFDEIKQIVGKTFGLSKPLMEALQSIENSIHLAFVYGSVAKKLDTASSDVDLLIVSDNLILEDLYKALEPAEQKIGRKINPTLLTKQEFTQRKAVSGSFISRVLEGEILDLIGSIDDL
jgi:predicted nucleotidyltransferase